VGAGRRGLLARIGRESTAKRHFFSVDRNLARTL
jgi:hypothetical protein